MNDYAYYKSIGICPDCGKRKAEAGKVHCKICNEQRNAYAKSHRDLLNKARKAMEERRKADHKCRICGKPVDTEGIYCSDCKWCRNLKRRIIKMRKKKGTWTGKFWDEMTKEKICIGILGKWGVL